MGLQGGYKIDICFVIDASGSMYPIIDKVKEHAKSLHTQITAGLEAAGKNVVELRIKVIDYSDFATEKDDAIHNSAFFTMPADVNAFSDCVNAISVVDAAGRGKGGDIRENGLEALHLALASDWNPIPRTAKGRHIVVLFTDAEPLPLGAREGCVGYEPIYPTNVADMEMAWNQEEDDQDGEKIYPISHKGRRLIAFAPCADGAGNWKEIFANWEWTVHQDVNPDTGLEEVDLDFLIAEIVRSV